VQPLKVAYLVNQYPLLSHSFIRREIAALEALGVDVRRYTLRQTAGPLAEEADRLELPKTAAVLSRPWSGKAAAALRAAAARPAGFLRALALAVRLGLKSDRGFFAHFAYLIEAAVIAAWCRADNVQHLHVHFGTNSATVGMLAHVMGDVPWSFTAHGPEEFDRPFGIALTEKIESARFVAAISSFGRSQLWRRTASRHWGKVKVVHCGLDESFLAGARAPVPSVPRLVCVGRLCEQKGQILLVEAVAILKARGVYCEIVFGGDGPMRAEIEAAIASAGLGDRIVIRGWISAAAVRAEIEAARALVLPSFAEGLPVVIMEAMALERPVVSTLVAGIPELVRPGETGWLVPAGDAQALALALEAAITAKPDELAAMGRAARARVLERHDAGTEAAKLKALFEEPMP
jgi:colanic acid/amylovoran biosynthesis glycosyltransferase